MQIYALDHLGGRVAVSEASRLARYTCPECRQELLLRGGLRRRLHFYHRERTSRCRQSGKSLLHLAIQRTIEQTFLPDNEIQLECRFPEIGRIADAVWVARKIVFEIQCSPISAEEIRERNSDYAKLGFSVVWLMHTRLYNHGRLSAAEHFLLRSPHYFTNHDANGMGIFYDQYSLLRSGRRVKRSQRLPINLSRLRHLNANQIPAHFSEERKNWSISFEGDLFCNPDLIVDLKEVQSPRRFRPYRTFILFLLEKMTS